MPVMDVLWVIAAVGIVAAIGALPMAIATLLWPVDHDAPRRAPPP